MINLSPEERASKGRTLSHDIIKDIQHRAEAEARRQVVRRMYYGNASRLDIHWDGASDIHLPVVTEKVEGTVPKWLGALMDAVPAVMLRRPADDPYRESVREQEQFINWALDNDIPDFRLAVEDWVRNACLDPVAYTKIMWQHEVRNTVEVHRLKAYWMPGEVTYANEQIAEDGEPQLKAPEDLLIDVFGAPVEMVGQSGLVNFVENEDGSMLVDFVEDRREYTEVHVAVEPSEFVDEIELRVFRPILVHDNPVVEVVEFEDLIVPFRSKCLQSAQRVTQQYWLSPSKIQSKVTAGEWQLSDADLERIAAQKTVTQEEVEENTGSKRILDSAVGETGKDEGVQGVAPFNEGKVLVFEVYTRDEFGNGEETEVIYQIPYCLQKVARADYLDSVFPHGRRPYADARWINVSGRYLGVSQGELLAAIQVQINTTVNQVNDNQELINNPIFFYEPTVMPKGGSELRNLAPGTGIPVASVGGVFFPQFQQQPLANLQTGLDPVLMFADRLTISPLQSGNTQMRNAPRTARGTLALLGEGNQKLDNVVKRHQKGGWNELVHQLLSLYQYYMPDEKWFWVIGDTNNRPARVTHKQMRGRWEIMFQGNTVNTNREVQRVLSQQRYQLAMTNPLYANDPEAMQEVLRDVLQAHSEGTDVERLMPRLPGQGANQHPPMSQKQENQALKQGISLDALPLDNHAEHIEEIDRFVRMPEFETLPEHTVALFAEHKRRHMAMLQAQITAQGQFGLPGADAGGGQEQSVAPDIGLGGLEGGVQ